MKYKGQSAMKIKGKKSEKFIKMIQDHFDNLPAEQITDSLVFLDEYKWVHNDGTFIHYYVATVNHDKMYQFIMKRSDFDKVEEFNWDELFDLQDTNGPDIRYTFSVKTLGESLLRKI